MNSKLLSTKMEINETNVWHRGHYSLVTLGFFLSWFHVAHGTTSFYDPKIDKKSAGPRDGQPPPPRDLQPSVRLAWEQSVFHAFLLPPQLISISRTMCFRPLLQSRALRILVWFDHRFVWRVKWLGKKPPKKTQQCIHNNLYRSALGFYLTWTRDGVLYSCFAGK